MMFLAFLKGKLANVFAHALRAWGCPRPPRVFRRWSKDGGVQRGCIRYTFFLIFLAAFVRFLCQGHFSSGHQGISGNLHPKRFKIA